MFKISWKLKETLHELILSCISFEITKYTKLLYEECKVYVSIDDNIEFPSKVPRNEVLKTYIFLSIYY